MASAAPRGYEQPLTYRILDDLPENDAERYEVIDGELYVASFPFVPHQRIVTRLIVMLGGYLDEHPIGEVFTSNLKVVLDEHTGVGPDIVYVAAEHLSGLQDDGFYGVPDLLVEVTSSKPSLDRVLKYRKYASAGVPSYWIINPGGRTMDVFELVNGEYVAAASLKADDTFSPKLFPGLTIELRRLWG